MITIIIPVYLVKEVHSLDDKVTQTDYVFEYAINFYKNYIGITEVDYEYFLTIGTFKFEVNFGLLKTETEIINQLSKADIPLIRYTIDKNMLSFVNRLYNDKINILRLSETLGGYELLIKDPFNNIIQIDCDDFDDENLDSIDFSKWSFYFRI